MMTNAKIHHPSTIINVVHVSNHTGFFPFVISFQGHSSSSCFFLFLPSFNGSPFLFYYFCILYLLNKPFQVWLSSLLQCSKFWMTMHRFLRKRMLTWLAHNLCTHKRSLKHTFSIMHWPRKRQRVRIEVCVLLAINFLASIKYLE